MCSTPIASSVIVGSYDMATIIAHRCHVVVARRDVAGFAGSIVRRSLF